jgi:hypothetical protein
MKLKLWVLKDFQFIKIIGEVIPSADVASHSIGFLAYQENELKGRYGLEHFMILF